MDALGNLLALLQDNLFIPLETALNSVSWVSDLLNLISNLLTTIFNYEIIITTAELSASLTCVLLVVCLVVIIKLFVGAFTTILKFYDAEKKGRRRR